MSPSGDDGDDMEAVRHIHDDVIEAIIRGEPVPGVHEPVAAFARQVRALGEGPAPVRRPSSSPCSAAGRDPGSGWSARRGWQVRARAVDPEGTACQESTGSLG